MASLPKKAGNYRFRGCTHPAARLLLAFILLAVAATPAFALQGQLNVNTATAKELQQLPFIGEAKARAILQLRQQGRLRDLADLQKSKIIGPSTYQAILPYLKLTGPHTLNDNAEPSPNGQPQSASQDNASFRARSLILTRPGEVQLLADDQYYPTITHLIRTARQRIDIAMFLFKTTEAKKNRPMLILQELTAARKRGVRVQVILEKSDYDEALNKENQQTANRLRKNGISVAFDDNKTTTHTKLAIIDQHLCLLGSHNFTHSALAYNHETSLLIDSRELAGQLLAYMEKLPE
ncbi:MAG: phospholipase D-like domain-containing protein [Desulfobulbaceae bacterium]|nr:phospholipase D-like domain-containing protein [Desulfobulbaceae bacterium]